MTTRITVSTASLFVKIFIFSFLIAASCNAHAEFYVYYGAPSVTVECDSCNQPHVVGAPYRPIHSPKKIKKPLHSKNHFQIDVYRVWQTIPPTPCDPVQTVPMCQTCSRCRVEQTYDMNHYHEPRGEKLVRDVYESGSIDRATVDDMPDVYPDMNIDH